MNINLRSSHFYWPVGIINTSCIGDEDTLLQCNFEFESGGSCASPHFALAVCQSSKFTL